MGDYDSKNPADQTRKGWLTSILELGAWVGTLMAGFFAEQYSRKISIIIATGVFIIGVVIQTTAVSGGHSSILAGRFITYDDLSTSFMAIWSLTLLAVVWEWALSV